MATKGYTGLAAADYLEYPVYKIQDRKRKTCLAPLFYIAIKQYTLQ